MRNVLLYILLIISLSAKGKPDCRISHFSELNDKALSVTRILQDRQGFMWIGTLNGLYRYDGYDFVNFKAKEGVGNQVISDHVASIYLSKDNHIWCLMRDRACFFNTQNCHFVDALEDLEKKSGRSYAVRKIRTMYDGTTWLITTDGLYICVRNDNSVINATVKLKGQPSDDRMITNDYKGRTWILTDHGTFMFNGKQLHFKRTFSDFLNSGKHSWLLDDRGHLQVLSPTDRILPFVNPMLTEPILEMKALKDNRIALITAKRLLLMNATTGAINDVGIRGRVNRIYQYEPKSFWLQMEDGRIMRFSVNPRNNLVIAGISSKISILTEDPDQTVWMLTEDGNLYYLLHGASMPQRYPTDDHNLKKSTNSLIDQQGNVWFLNETGMNKLTFDRQYLQPVLQESPSEIRSAMVDSKGRYWLSGKEDNTLRLFDRSNRPLGYLGADGQLHSTYTAFGSHFYCMMQDRSGQIWLGSKPDGLFRLRETSSGIFLVRQFKEGQGKYDLSSGDIYNMIQDQQGRLWVATHDGGLNCIKDIQADKPIFYNSRNTSSLSLKVCNFNVLSITHNNILLCGSDNGLLIADLHSPSLQQLKFRYHNCERSRKNSLSCNYITGIIENHQHKLFICTESGGLNEIITDNLLSEKLEFKHFNLGTGFLSDISQAIFEYHNHIWILALNQLIELDPDNMEEKESNTYFKRNNIIFSQCHPILLSDGQWLFGTENGAYTVRLDELRKLQDMPKIAITGLKIEGKEPLYHINNSDTIILEPDERSFMLNFAALEFTEKDLISYAYHMDDEKTSWIYLGNSHSISFVDMNPGKYIIKIRSTNGNGIWVDNTRTLTIIIKAKFWETPWATILLLLLLSSIVYGIVHTHLYMKRIRQQQWEAMNKYMKLLDKSSFQAEQKAQPIDRIPSSNKNTSDDDFMNQLMAFIKQNLGNSELTIEDMAEVLATSQSGLNRKLKQTLGTTPSELLKNVRIEHACSLLKADIEMNISEIAYICGFADPKYFSRCFKATKGMTPSDYRLSQ